MYLVYCEVTCSDRELTPNCCSSQLCKALYCLSAQCFGFNACNLTVLVHSSLYIFRIFFGLYFDRTENGAGSQTQPWATATSSVRGVHACTELLWWPNSTSLHIKMCNCICEKVRINLLILCGSRGSCM